MTRLRPLFIHYFYFEAEKKTAKKRQKNVCVPLPSTTRTIVPFLIVILFQCVIMKSREEERHVFNEEQNPTKSL